MDHSEACGSPARFTFSRHRLKMQGIVQLHKPVPDRRFVFGQIILYTQFFRQIYQTPCSNFVHFFIPFATEILGKCFKKAMPHAIICLLK
jgi:hypothetical protein